MKGHLSELRHGCHGFAVGGGWGGPCHATGVREGGGGLMRSVKKKFFSGSGTKKSKVPNWVKTQQKHVFWTPHAMGSILSILMPGKFSQKVRFLRQFSKKFCPFFRQFSKIFGAFGAENFGGLHATPRGSKTGGGGGVCHATALG